MKFVLTLGAIAALMFVGSSDRNAGAATVVDKDPICITVGIPPYTTRVCTP